MGGLPLAASAGLPAFPFGYRRFVALAIEFLIFRAEAGFRLLIEGFPRSWSRHVAILLHGRQISLFPPQVRHQGLDPGSVPLALFHCLAGQGLLLVHLVLLVGGSAVPAALLAPWGGWPPQEATRVARAISATNEAAGDRVDPWALEVMALALCCQECQFPSGDFTCPGLVRPTAEQVVVAGRVELGAGLARGLQGRTHHVEGGADQIPLPAGGRHLP